MATVSTTSNKGALHIIGNGAIGSLLAAAASRHHCDYVLYPRQLPASPQYVKWSDKERIPLLSFSAHKPSLTQHDVLLLPLKVYQLRAALTAWLPFLDKHTPVVLMHNGMGGYEMAKQLLPVQQPLWLATTSHGAMRDNQQTISYTGKGQIQIGRPSEFDSELAKTPETDEVPLPVSLLQRILPPVSWEDNIEFALWQKLAVNMVINPLTALHDVPNGAIATDEFAELRQALCQEFVAIAKACGHHFNVIAVEETILAVATKTKANYSSMHQDMRYQRPTEIDGINGYLVEMAKKKGINASVNALMVEQVKQRSNHK